MLLELLFPPTCAGCKSWGAYLCDSCRKEVRFFDFSICPMCDHPTLDGKTHSSCRTPYGLDGFIPIAQYVEPTSSLIKKIKYAQVKDASREAYHFLSYHWPTYAPIFDALVPIPLHPKKLRERGFNQAELLAKQISRLNTSPVITDTLIKVRETQTQASLRLKQRKKNVQQGFVCLHKKHIEGKVIGLVDDVATTRTTLSLACTVLKKAGAKEVWGVVLAHRF